MRRRERRDALRGGRGADGRTPRATPTAALVYDDPDFDDFFRAATPVEEISRQQLGSRPPRARPDGGDRGLPGDPVGVLVDAVADRAARLVRARHRAARTRSTTHGLELLQEMARDWPFFAALLSNAEMACAKADLGDRPPLRRAVRRRGAARAHLERDRRTSSSAPTRLLARDRRRRRAAQPRAGAARLDRPPQPVRRPALLRAARAAAPHARGRRRAGRRSWPARACTPSTASPAGCGTRDDALRRPATSTTAAEWPASRGSAARRRTRRSSAGAAGAGEPRAPRRGGRRRRDGGRRRHPRPDAARPAGDRRARSRRLRRRRVPAARRRRPRHAVEATLERTVAKRGPARARLERRAGRPRGGGRGRAAPRRR